MPLTIRGDRLVAALQYLIWWQADCQKMKLHPQKMAELEPFINAYAYVKNARILDRIQPSIVAERAWNHILGENEIVLGGPYVSMCRVLATAIDASMVNYRIEDVASLLEPVRFHHAGMEWDSSHKREYLALVDYLKQFGCGEISDDDLT